MSCIFAGLIRLLTGRVSLHYHATLPLHVEVINKMVTVSGSKILLALPGDIVVYVAKTSRVVGAAAVLRALVAYNG